ncbi:exosortase F system-associated membrane protein [Flavobacterium gelatinilyticum]|uniref:exosortase F system-associated membrane protein n=1 Tax=Flavobacterium gelatinilyticum TaxID=3003260 RepID=UPI0024809B1E|nr:exosortase F system-associated protein [Flavobacterium gelatinilyticum]
MLNSFKQQKNKILITIGVVFCFALIRAFENALFYDPFLYYFEGDFAKKPLPEINSFKLFLNLLFRYALNTILSLILLYGLFRDMGIFNFSAFLYGFFLIVLFGMFFTIVKYFPDNSWLLFYVRRFIIQPIFVILFIPAFYYQLQNLEK